MDRDKDRIVWIVRTKDRRIVICMEWMKVVVVVDVLAEIRVEIEIKKSTGGEGVPQSQSQSQSIVSQSPVTSR